MERAAVLRIAICLLSLLCLLPVEVSTESAKAFYRGGGEAGENARKVAEESGQAFLLRQIFDKKSEGKAGEEHGPKSIVTQEALVCKDDDDEKGLLQELCPVACFRPDPVCGEDGITYWCGCRDARCAGAAVSHVGFCKIRSSAPTEKGSQALLLVHALWLALVGISCLFGFL